MKKTIAALVLALAGILIAGAQSKYSTKTGTITFDASVPSFEAIAAENHQVSAILNAETGEFAALALIQGFRFEIALMEEHFNENYMESEDYPKAIFKGKILEFNQGELTGSSNEYQLKGVMSMHGRELPLTVPVIVTNGEGTITLKTEFNLQPEQFDIDVPKVVGNKIAKDVHVVVDLSLNQ